MYWIRNRTASPKHPDTNDGDFVSNVEAITDPKAIVIAKSKLDILEKLRSPDRRVNSKRVT
ncbi:hypothetical protein GCM10023156_19290 [Novipirellula rosea]|uniref:Uncharacterized protein n=1 Tax=Novipirellula rosea TaxID=1031540 RepID=A0ABP8MLR5_9BACT